MRVGVCGQKVSLAAFNRNHPGGAGLRAGGAGDGLQSSGLPGGRGGGSHRCDPLS